LAGRRPPLRLRALGWWRQRTDEPTPDPEPVNGWEILDKLANLPVSTWHYHWEPAEIRHLGPMAQDFAATFGLGDDDRSINMVDANGVLTVAVQALYRKVQELEAELEALKSKAG
jgi:hypothetical protein